MKKLALTLNGLAILFNVITVQGMELSHKNNSLLDLDALNQIFFSQPFNTSIRSFKNLSSTSKDYKNTVTFKNILMFYKNPIGTSEIFLDSRTGGNNGNNKISTITNILLERAILGSDQKLVTTLLDLGANPNARSLHDIPVFFYAKNSNIAKIFIQHADIHATTADNHTNVLWEVLQHKYPAELLELYLKEGVSPRNISWLDKSCLFHEFTILCQTFQKKDHNAFFRKTCLLLSSAQDMINTLNCNGLTPLDEAKRVFYIERNYARQVNAHRKRNNKSPIINERHKAAFTLIELYQGFGGVTAQQLIEQKNITKKTGPLLTL